MRALRAPNRAQRILWRISRDLNEAAPNGAVARFLTSGLTQTLTLTGTLTLTLALTQLTLYTHSSVSSVLLARRRTVVVVYILLQLRLLLYHINYILQCDIGNNIIQHGNVRTRTLILIVIRHQKYLILILI